MLLNITSADALSLRSTFPIGDLPPELYLQVFEKALTLRRPLVYTCPHLHEEDSPVWCTHNIWCNHELVRPSLCKMPPFDSSPDDGDGNDEDEGQHMFWLSILADKFCYASVSSMISRFNTVVFTEETLACLSELEWATFKFPKLHPTASVPRTPKPICHSEQLRSIHVEMDFTGIQDLTGQLCSMRRLQHLTLIAMDFAPTIMMLADFEDVVGELPSLRSCRIVFEAERLRRCMHCGKRRECELWERFFQKEAEVVKTINEKVEKMIEAKRNQTAMELDEDSGSKADGDAAVEGGMSVGSATSDEGTEDEDEDMEDVDDTDDTSEDEL